ncbi:DUF3068 domain-containing protein [Nocardioides acrostichi]|uniref:DUF3068 domain-containing protein n=1 Tax=Nocardioides acrostichi TaxID=2784339 RepID=A0A930V118_9ACTN|nr:DUF3068 domain-containing protein [Nocardioides acrostichi]MBF4161911.1 DUF3068 domain-containing protein [Nocardioides acrostichi]
MRIWIGRVVAGLGVFLLVVGVLALVWAPGALQKTPKKVDTTTYLDGTVQKLDAATGELGEQQPVGAISVTKTDSEASTADDVAWIQSTCVMITDGSDAQPVCTKGSDDMVTASVDVFGTDRVTGLAVENGTDGLQLGPDATPHDGLVNKWPFDSEKKTYPYWDGTLGKALPATYVGSESLDGLTTYKYEVKVTDQPAEIAADTQGTYSTVKDIWVEPVTGSIVNQTESQQRYLEDGTQVLDLQLGFTTDQVATSVAEAKTNSSGLTLLVHTVPLVGLVGGALLLVVGAAVLMLGRRRTDAAHVDSARPTAGAGV